jgi:hypothetical protein
MYLKGRYIGVDSSDYSTRAAEGIEPHEEGTPRAYLSAGNLHNLPINRSTIRINRINPNPPLG